MRTFGSMVVGAVLACLTVFLLYGLVPRRPLPGAAQVRRAPPARVVVPPAAPRPRETTAIPAVSPEALASVDADEQVNIQVYAAVNKSVVNITTSTEGAGFFGDEVANGSGSGFVIDGQGHILTNFHVIQGAQAVQVQLYDSSTLDAEVVGADPSNDVAIVRVKLPRDKVVPPLRLGDSSRLLVGRKVLAVGNPFGLERTLTTGIVSALDRTMRAKNDRLIRGIIQTDAAINPGNSGGPLLDTRGEVVGLTTAIISQVGQSAGIGFAIPIDAIKRILPQLLEHGRVIRADLGIRRIFTTDEGLLIGELVENGPADRAGLQPIRARIERVGPFRVRRLDPETADLIVAVDGKRVRNSDELLNEVESHAPGDTVTLTVVRSGRARKVRVVLGQS
jgi:S1-C subfamily serine protease